MNVLALDLATLAGWAVGEPGAEPAHGSVRFASVGASHEAIFASAHKWMVEQMVLHEPEMVIWESPLPTSFRQGRSTVDTTSLLYGLPAVVGTVAYLGGVYNIRKADTKDVRLHFIGCNPKRAKAKPMVKRQCRAMGWEVDDDNEADALATWHYMCSLLEPKLALRPTPLFGRR
jgi:crossover junction endodeoxyribonuclease RuvC